MTSLLAPRRRRRRRTERLRWRAELGVRPRIPLILRCPLALGRRTRGHGHQRGACHLQDVVLPFLLVRVTPGRSAADDASVRVADAVGVAAAGRDWGFSAPGGRRPGARRRPLAPRRRPLAIPDGGPLPGLNLSRVLAVVAILHHRGERRGVDGVYGQRQERLVRRVESLAHRGRAPSSHAYGNILPPKRLVHLPVRLERLEERVQLVVGPSRTERGGLRRSSLASLLFLRFGRRRSSDTGSNARAVVGGRDEFLSHARQPENSPWRGNDGDLRVAHLRPAARGR